MIPIETWTKVNRVTTEEPKRKNSEQLQISVMRIKTITKKSTNKLRNTVPKALHHPGGTGVSKAWHYPYSAILSDNVTQEVRVPIDSLTISFKSWILNNFFGLWIFVEET